MYDAVEFFSYIFHHSLIIIGIIAILILIFKSVVIVGGTELAVLERKYFGTKMPKGRVVAMANEIGVQARTLGPGLHLLIPFLYSTQKQYFTSLAENEVGMIESIDGDPVPAGKIFARMVEGHNAFQDGEAFLKNGGQKGPQTQILPPGSYRINTVLFKVKKLAVVTVEENEIALISSTDGSPIPPGKIFARVVTGHNAFQDGEAFLQNGGEKGPQIELLPPGTYRINLDLFSVRKVPAIVVEKGKIGVVTSMDGEPIPAGRLLAQKVEGHSNFENGQAFLDKGGQKGPQIDVLLPGTYRINTDLFHVEIKDATVVPANNVGLVTALDGEPLPEEEYVAKPVTGHNDYQAASTFLHAGGQRGPQFDVLKPGTYYVNPLIFKVDLDDVAVVERGQVAVVVSNVGEEPHQIKSLIDEQARGEGAVAGSEVYKEIEDRFKKGVERYVVPKGFRGIQQEVAGPGFYYLNRRAYIVYIVDTTNITIDWDDAKETRFNPLKVISRDGFDISVSVKVVIRVRPDQAPYMVAKIGSIENLILHVIHPMIDSSFRNQASSTSAMNFMQDRQEEQRKAEERARSEMEKYHVECVSVLICQITLPQDLMDTQTRKIIAQQQQAMYQDQQKAEQTRIATEKTRAEADQQKNLVEAEIGVKIAEQNKEKAIRFAEGEAESIRLRMEGEAKGVRARGEAEGAKILAMGEATAKAYELQNIAIGQKGVTAIEIAKQIAAGNIKVTPDFLVQGGENIGGLLSAFLTQIIAGSRPEAAVVAVAQEAPVAKEG
ncbi:MAG TPA: SPFH domain-containing protein [Geobacteraceae bacterium]|nr:SPFH domain-containing protein [Geobacteraceae bacterium]